MPPSPPGAASSRARRRSSPSVSIVISLRDAAGLAATLRALPPVDEVVVVTTGSPSTDAVVRASCPAAVLLRHNGTGIGPALVRGIAASRGDVVVALDGSGGPDLTELPRLVAALLGGADAAFGLVDRPDGPIVTAGRLHQIMEMARTWVTKVLSGAPQTESDLGLVGFRRAAFERMNLLDSARPARATWDDGAEFAALLRARARMLGLRVADVSAAVGHNAAGYALARSTDAGESADALSIATGNTGVGNTGAHAGVGNIAAWNAGARNTSDEARRSPGMPGMRDAPNPWTSDLMNTVGGAGRHSRRDTKPTGTDSSRWTNASALDGGPEPYEVFESWPPPRARRTGPDHAPGRRSTAGRHSHGHGGQHSGVPNSGVHGAQHSHGHHSAGHSGQHGGGYVRRHSAGHTGRHSAGRSTAQLPQPNGPQRHLLGTYQQLRPDLRVINGSTSGHTRATPWENLDG